MVRETTTSVVLANSDTSAYDGSISRGTLSLEHWYMEANDPSYTILEDQDAELYHEIKVANSGRHDQPTKLLGLA